jgi:hypothetical protein
MARRGAPLGLLAALAAFDPSFAATIRPGEAASHAGREVTVEGYVERVVCSSRACLLSFGAGFSGLVVSIPSSVGERMPPAREEFEGRTVRVTAVVTMLEDRPRMEIDDPADVERVDVSVGVVAGHVSTKSDAGEGAASTAAPGERQVSVHVEAEPKGGGVAEITRALEAEDGGARAAAPEGASGLAARVSALEERVGETAALPPGMLPLTDGPVAPDQPDDLASVRDHVGGLDEQIADLANAVALLEQRLAALETAVASAAAPQLPGYVVAGERSPTLNRVRRGWSADRVLRTLGEPAQVVGTGAGQATWLYGGGRSVTIDERGRVTAAAGF